MTAGEWETCDSPRLMLRQLRRSLGNERWSSWNNNPELVPRKWRLFAVDCCRRVPRLNRQEEQILDLVEALAEAVPDHAHATAVIAECRRLAGVARHRSAGLVVTGGLMAAAVGWARREIAHRAATGLRGPKREHVFREAYYAEARVQADLLRELFVNPVLRFSFDSRWKTPVAVDLAGSMYISGTFDRMVDLAEVLQQAGCCNRQIQAHCREGGPHKRGCWLVDMVLGRG